MGRAFTLIELVVVIAVMAIAGAVAIPSMAASSGQYRAELASRRIAADLQLIQRDSWYNASTAKVVFDAANDAYDLVNLGGSGATTRVELGAAPYRVDLTAAGFDGAAEIEFAGGVPAVTTGGFVKLTSRGVSFQATFVGDQEISLDTVTRASAGL